MKEKELIKELYNHYFNHNSNKKVLSVNKLKEEIVDTITNSNDISDIEKSEVLENIDTIIKHKEKKRSILKVI